MGTVRLTVSDLERSIAYYEQLGLRHQGGGALGTGGPALLELRGLDPAHPARPADGYAGLFHFALLLPARADLGAWLVQNRLPLTGLSDHAVSEAVYLRDPDGHGIELYADRPREQWEGRVLELMTTKPLDVRDLTAAAGPYAGLPPGTTMGHVHLRVADVEDSVRFYREQLGMEVMAHFGGQAAFLAWDGYHHHIGVNVWESRGAPPAPDGYATLIDAEVLGTGRDEVLRDPSGLRLRLTR